MPIQEKGLEEPHVVAHTHKHLLILDLNKTKSDEIATFSVFVHLDILLIA